MRNKKVEFREKVLCDDVDIAYLQVRVMPSSKYNIFEWIKMKWFYNWTYVFYKSTESYCNILRCGYDGMPSIHWFKYNIHTFGEFNDFLDRIEEESLGNGQ